MLRFATRSACAPSRHRAASVRIVPTYLTVAALALAAAAPAAAESDSEAGKRAFRACQACHSLAPGRHMTGPSLARLFGRRAGGVADFPRYSPAMRQADVEWNEQTLDKFLADPQSFVRGNWMVFPGIADTADRANLIAYLKASQTAGAPPPRVPSLKEAPPRFLVTAVRLCGDTYFVTTGDGETRVFWEFNLRFKTNSSAEGPAPGKPVILRAGMVGDRASVIFASPKELSAFIAVRCQ